MCFPELVDCANCGCVNGVRPAAAGAFVIDALKPGDPPLYDSRVCPRLTITSFSAFAVQEHFWLDKA